MSDGRKRLSGAEYRKNAKIKKDKQEHALQKTRKIEAFFKSENSNEGLRNAQENSGISNNKENQHEQGSVPVEVKSLYHQKQSNQSCPVKLVHPPDSDTEIPSTSKCYSKSDNEEVAIVTTSTEIHSITKLNTDPALWEINDLTRDIIARNGFEQNKSCDFTKSGRMYSDHRRYLPKNIFYRKMKNNEVKERNWLVYSESKSSVFCGPCMAFGSFENKTQFDEQGFNDWKNAEVRVAQHENSPSHKSCILALRARSVIHGNIQSSLTIQLNEEISYWKNILKRVVAVIKGLASRGLAFRGSNEKYGDQHSGNYIMLLELIAEFDPLLAKHIERYANQGSGTTSYLSKTVCDEFISLMAEKVLIYISNEIKKAKYFSLIVDSTPDAAHIDQLTLVIRYVLDNGEPCERFIKFLPSVGHKAQEMFDAITIELEQLNINLKDCRGQSYDNASNMSGIYNGLQAKIQEQAPFAMFVPCAAHSLNLVGTSAAESCPEACRFFMLLEEVYTFFVKSTERWKKLINEIGRGKRLKRVNLTRWSARSDACKSLRDSWDEVVTVLKIIENDTTEKPVPRNEAKGIRIKLEKLETAFMVVFWNAILERLNKVSIQIQSSSVDVLTVSDLYGSLVEFTIAERDNFDYFEEKAIEMSALKQYQGEIKRQPKRKKMTDETSNEEPETPYGSRDFFRVDTFLVILDRLRAEIERRHNAYLNFKEKFLFLTKITEFSTQIVTEKAQSLVKYYTNDLEEDLVQECVHFHSYIPLVMLQNVQ
ncbi:zinc finger MYM-type protein 1-like [Diabrotica virgifera virgifera]|uniref:TTF-type domain-containing protein n=1 Tax=Diabrotica virgifera virgifera TaxID=50390 RepID=A0ABM5KNH4_DIAVI|nr:zinc finger MYM-type protein 1-like [Diabrotica virgifera virgifera]